MTVALELRQHTLQELGDEANRQHDAGCQSAADALFHWIASGQALIEARKVCETEGQPWGEWVAANFHGNPSTAQAFIRLATYRDLLATKPEGIGTVAGALRFLRGLPASAPRGPRGGYTAVDSDGTLAKEARRLLSAGATQADVAAMFGVSNITVWRWKDPERARATRAREKRTRRARDRATARAIKQTARDDAVREIGGEIAESYSLMRRAAQSLDRAHDQAKDREVRAACKGALAKLYGAEDEIVRALGIT